MVCKCTDEAALKKFMMVRSTEKMMLTIFRDAKGMIYREYLSPYLIDTVNHYFNALMPLRNSIKRERPGLLSKGVTLLHGKVHAHSAAQMTTLQRIFVGMLLDLVLSNFHHYVTLKMELGDKYFRIIDE